MLTYELLVPNGFGFFVSAATHPTGTMRDVYDWDSGRYLGQIVEAETTYNVVGNINEFGWVSNNYLHLLLFEIHDIIIQAHYWRDNFRWLGSSAITKRCKDRLWVAYLDHFTTCEECS